MLFPPDGHPYDRPPGEPRTDGNLVLQAIFVWGVCILIGGSLGWTALALVFNIKV